MIISVVTGASSGMGLEFARTLDRQERIDEIWLIARREERLNELAGQLSKKARVIPLDLTKGESFDEYERLLEAEKPLISTLVNAAGFGKFALFEDIPIEANMGMIDLNAKAVAAMCQLSLPYMRRRSRIINLDSLSSFQPVPYLNIYAATKAFILSFSRALGVELKPRGIRVLAVCPGWVDTEFFDHAIVDENAVTYYNKVFKPQDVVKKALEDYKLGREVSILGASIRAQVLLTKLLPHSLVIKLWMKQQKHDKRPDAD